MSGKGEDRAEMERHEERLEKDLGKLVTALSEKEQEIRKISNVNNELDSKNGAMMERILELEEDLERINRRILSLEDQFTLTL